MDVQPPKLIYIYIYYIYTVDGRNPAPVGIWFNFPIIPLFTIHDLQVMDHLEDSVPSSERQRRVVSFICRCRMEEELKRISRFAVNQNVGPRIGEPSDHPKLELPGHIS